MNGRDARAEQTKVVERLSGQIVECDQVLGELTIANRVLELPMSVENVTARCHPSR